MASEKRHEKLSQIVEHCDDHFEQLVMKLGSGAIAISLTLLSLSSDFQQSKFIWILFVGWLLIVIALMFKLCSMMYASKEARKAQQIKPEDKTEYNNWAKRYNRIVDIHQWMIASLAILGITAILLFAVCHIACPQEPKEEAKTHECCCCCTPDKND